MDWIKYVLKPEKLPVTLMVVGFGICALLVLVLLFTIHWTVGVAATGLWIGLIGALLHDIRNTRKYRSLRDIR